MGFEIDPALVAQAVERARRLGLADRVTFRQDDLFQADLREATVVTLYLSGIARAVVVVSPSWPEVPSAPMAPAPRIRTSTSPLSATWAMGSRPSRSTHRT